MNLKTACLFVLTLFTALDALAAVSSSAPPQSQETPAFAEFISPKIDAHSVMYRVQKGDTLTKIAKKNNVTADLLSLINRVDEKKLKIGAGIKIPTYKLSVVVDKSQNVLILKGDEVVLKTYVVATGSNNSTPVGTFKVTEKLVDPTWWKDNKAIKPGSPENQLGTRWLGIDKPSYGIHGTIEPETLGQQVTAGCVRMKNEEVEELYRIIPTGTEVTITD